MIEGEEVRDVKTLSKIKTVDEFIPKPAKEDQREKWNLARIWETQYRIIEEYLMMDATIEEACMAAGISVPSYYHHKSEHPEFARRMAIAKEYPKVAARAAVMKRIRLGDAKTAMDYLKLRDRRYKPEYEETESASVPKVQFISVASNEWNEKGSQTSIEQKSPSEWYSSSWEVEMEEKMTAWENEEQVLRNINSLSFSSD